MRLGASMQGGIPDRVDFFVGNDGRRVPPPDQRDYIRNRQRAHAIEQRDAHKHIPRKQRQLQLHAPVLPLVYGGIAGKQMFHAPFRQSLRDTPFLVGTYEKNVPPKLLPSEERFAGWFHLRICCGYAHSVPVSRVASPRPLQGICDIPSMLAVLSASCAPASQFFPASELRHQVGPDSGGTNVLCPGD